VDGTAPVVLASPAKEGTGVLSGSFSPDGRRLVTCENAGKTKEQQALDMFFARMGGPKPPPRRAEARIWDTRAGRPVALKPLEHGGDVNHAEFSPGGERVVTASDDGTARVWDAATGEPRTQPLAAERRAAGLRAGVS